MLLESGAPPNEANCLGVTPLYEASTRGYAHIVRHLAVGRADLDARCHDGTTALLQAAYVGSVDAGKAAACATVVALLLELGADAKAKDGWGKTAATWVRWIFV